MAKQANILPFYETHLNKEFTNKGTKFFLSYGDAHQYVSEAFANLEGKVTCFKEWQALGADNFMVKLKK